MNQSYFITWSQQKNAETIGVAGVQDTFLQLTNGRRIDDFVSTSFNSSFGHSHPQIISRITNQLNKMPIAGPRWQFEFKEEQTRRLIQFLGFQSGKIFYTTSGSEAVENALKIARQISQKKIVLCRNKSYHGATLGALSVTGDWRNKEHFTVEDWTCRIPEPYDDIDLRQTREIINKVGPQNIAAFCLEVISGTNGVVIPDQAWWSGIQNLCEEFGIYLIVDEVLTGFGRTGKPFAFHHYDLKPDFVTMSKGISGGYIPFGAVWTSDKIAQFYDEKILSCGLTSYAHPLGLAAMSAALDLFDDQEFLTDIAQKSDLIRKYLNDLKTVNAIKDIRVAGFLAAVEFKPEFKVNSDMFFEHNLCVITKGSEVFIAPALTYKLDDLEDALTRFQAAILSIAQKV